MWQFLFSGFFNFINEQFLFKLKYFSFAIFQSLFSFEEWLKTNSTEREKTSLAIHLYQREKHLGSNNYIIINVEVLLHRKSLKRG